MKESYNKNIQLQCITCGDTAFEFNEYKSWVKCKRCGKEYLGGYDELVELNTENINREIEDSKDVSAEIRNSLKKAFNGSKFIKFKG